jgi:hypothetical protein
MSTQSTEVAQSLALLEERIVSPNLIDAAFACGELATQSLIMTSMGNASEAVITPYYTSLQFENNLFDRLGWAATIRRPFVEAGVRVKKSEDRLVAANIVIRYCEQPGLDGNSVLETASTLPLDPSKRYGTIESVVDEVCRQRDNGKEIPARTGWVEVPAIPSKKGKWAISRTESISEPYAAECIPKFIQEKISDDLTFVTSFIS